MSLTERVVWVIERNLAAAHTLDSLAQTVGVSRFHLAHAFAAATGSSVLQYLRGRRLSEAAHKLAQGAPDIMQLALDAGYGSHEAFSRAFRERLGTSPETVRQRGSVASLPLVSPMRSRGEVAVSLSPPRFERLPERVFVGLCLRHQVGDATAIAAQWAQFMTVFHEVDDLLDPIPWGLSSGIDDEGSLTYWSAALVRRARPVRGLDRVSLPSQLYAVFSHEGHASQIGRTYEAIWNQWLPSSGRRPADGLSLDRHLPSFDPTTGLGGVELWTPVEA